MFAYASFSGQIIFDLTHYCQKMAQIWHKVLCRFSEYREELRD